MPRTRTHRGVEYPVSDAHPAAECFPWMPEDRLQELADSITAHGGLIYKVRRLPDGRVYDGRNRELACRVAGVEPEYAEGAMDDAAVIAFVRHANLARRDLTPSQRAAAAAELAALEGGPSHGAAAEQFGVGVRTVSAAAAVLKADKPLFEAVKAGAVAASLAEAAVKGLPAPVRAAALADPEPGPALRVALATVQEPDPIPEVDVGDPDDEALALEGHEAEMREFDPYAPAGLRELDRLHAEFERGLAEDGGKWPGYTGPGGGSEPDDDDDPPMWEGTGEVIEGGEAVHTETELNPLSAEELKTPPAEVSFEEWHATLPVKKDKVPERPNGPPESDNPYWHLMRACTELKGLFQDEFKNDASGVLLEGLRHMRLVTAKLPWVVFHSGKIVDGKATPPRAEFVAIDLTRRLVRKLGKMAMKKKKPTLVQIKKAMDAIAAEVERGIDTDAEGKE